MCCAVAESIGDSNAAECNCEIARDGDEVHRVAAAANRFGDGIRAPPIGEDESIIARAAINRVIPSAACQHIITARARDRIVTGKTINDVDAAISGERVVCLTADDVLNANDAAHCLAVPVVKFTVTSDKYAV